MSIQLGRQLCRVAVLRLEPKKIISTYRLPDQRRMSGEQLQWRLGWTALYLIHTRNGPSSRKGRWGGARATGREGGLDMNVLVSLHANAYREAAGSCRWMIGRLRIPGITR
jgi:hypothetical protein